MMFTTLVDTIMGTDSPQAKIFAANLEKLHDVACAKCTSVDQLRFKSEATYGFSTDCSP